MWRAASRLSAERLMSIILDASRLARLRQFRFQVFILAKSIPLSIEPSTILEHAVYACSIVMILYTVPHCIGKNR